MGHENQQKEVKGEVELLENDKIERRARGRESDVNSQRGQGRQTYMLFRTSTVNVCRNHGN